MPSDRCEVVVVHRRAADALVVDRKAARLDDVERCLETGGQSDEGTQVLRNVGLEEGEAHGVFYSCPRRGKRPPCGTLSHNAGCPAATWACDQQSLET